MTEGTDYAQQTNAVNTIDDVLISEDQRIVCYSQPIYEDVRLEQHEYIGLMLGVRDYFLTTALTVVEPMKSQASILILDNDSRFGPCNHYHLE